MDPKKTLAVLPERVEQLVTALSFASTDMFDHPNAQVQIGAEDEFGTLESAFSVFLTELAQAKSELRRSLAEVQAKLDLIEKQQNIIRELSTPILDVSEGVLLVPVVGAIDAERATEMTERLLGRVVQRGARAVILDVTGVDVVDTLTADHLVRLTRATNLLGARSVITGISPAVARTLVEMGGDLGGVRTLRTLRDGLRLFIEHAGAPVRSEHAGRR